MLVFPLLRLVAPGVAATDVKIHLAVFNGKDDPLHLFAAGTFDPWQEHQNRANFPRQFVLGLIEMGQRHQWLFAGLYRVQGKPRPEQDGTFRYSLAPLQEYASLAGRLVVRFERPGRQSYLNADRWADRLHVASVLPEAYQVADFPGYTRVHLSFADLQTIARQEQPSWRTALSAVAGVYVVSDEATGKLYVGSATGEGGFWARWCQYAETGHGGNVRLRDLGLAPGYSPATLHFAILETADTRSAPDEVQKREQYWKHVLCTRRHGNNAN